MHVLILALAWITPAIIAGALGWSGIWGSGSALVEYLIPIPVAGGVLHVPSFVVAAFLILGARKSAGAAAQYLPVFAFAVLVTALSLMIEFDRLNMWLFTDYDPARSPLRLDGNPLLLFVACDAFWVGTYAKMRGFTSPARSWFLLPAIPAVVIGVSAFRYQTSGPVFDLGRPVYTEVRGEEVISVYTSAEYDEQVFLEWLARDPFFGRPWEDVNSEHVAILFSNSMEAMKYGTIEPVDSPNTVATICLYEEDRSIDAHRGYFDCFAERNTAEEEMAALAESQPTGFGQDIDSWYARLLMCDDVEIPDEYTGDIARVGICRGMRRVYADSVSRFIQNYGEDSEQVSFVRTEWAARGLTEE